MDLKYYHLYIYLLIYYQFKLAFHIWKVHSSKLLLIEFKFIIATDIKLLFDFLNDK